MTALLYFLVAMLAAGVSARTWLANRTDPARVAFFAEGLAICIAYMSFALSLLPRLETLRVLYLGAGMVVPVAALWALDRALDRPADARAAPVQRLATATVILAPLLTVLEATLYRDWGHASPAELLGGSFAFFGLVLVLQRIWQARHAASERSERVRLEYLLAVVLAAVGFALFEHLGRLLSPSVDVTAISEIRTRVYLLQGPVPPFSTLFVGLAVYFQYQALVMGRLFDLQELFSRVSALLVSALLLLAIDGFTLAWVGTFTDHPFHSTFQVFTASLLFLGAYEPLQAQIGWAANRVFNRRGQHLHEAAGHLRAQLPTIISAHGVAETLLSRLHATGRAPVCSVYLWDRGLDAFACTASRGEVEQRPLAAVAGQSFAEPFVGGEPWLIEAEVARRALTSDAWAEVHALMRAMNAQLTVPVLSESRSVLGWLNLADETWSDGYSADEVLALQRVMRLAALVLGNIEEFRAAEEAQRLAVLGAMAAGLAHEIRNPLAGIKGAAQYLQGEQLDGTAQEMLCIVVDETDRLNIVVSQFLDYARPFELHTAPEQLDAIASRALALLRAQGLPEGITLREALAGDLPITELDAARLTQVVVNLLRNALQAMPEGGELFVRTRLRVSRIGAALELMVTDSGPGLSADVRDKIFVPFFTTKDHGTGLGLAISQRIVRAHGGELEATSPEGGGARFTVRIPLPADEPTAEV